MKEFAVNQMMLQAGEKTPVRLATVYFDAEYFTPEEAVEMAYTDCINVFYHSKLGANRKGMTKFWAELA